MKTSSSLAGCLRLAGAAGAALVGACTVVPSEPVALPEHPRIGLLDLTARQAKVVHVGTTTFTNIEGAPLVPEIGMREFFERDLDARIAQLYGAPLAVKGDQVEEAALSTQRMDNAFLVGNAKFDRTIVSELRKDVVSSVGRFGLDNKLDMVVVVWTYPGADNISGSSVQMSDYGLFTANRFGFKSVAAYAHVAVAFVNPGTGELGSCERVEKPKNYAAISSGYEEGSAAISPELHAQVQANLEQIFDQNAQLIAYCLEGVKAGVVQQ